MGNKNKGSNAERELIHMFWERNWAAIRVAGSGSMQYPSPDIMASKEGKHIIIECKSTKEKHKYIHKQDIDDLIDYSKRAGMPAYIAIRFPRLPWYFLEPQQLRRTENNCVITLQEAQKNGKKIDEI